MAPFWISLVILTATTNLYHVYCENILVFMPLPARSHFRSFQPLFEELIKRGHNITLVSGHTLSDNLQDRYEHINIKHIFPKLRINFAEMRKQNRLSNFIFSSERVIEYEECVLQDPKIRRLLASRESRKFHSIIVEFFFMDSFVALGSHFDAPVVAVSPQSLLPFYSATVGNPVTPSYIPNLFLPFTDHMSFTERLLNAIYTAIIGIYYECIALSKHQKQIEKYFSFQNDRKEIPKIKNLIQNVSLVLVNSHYAFGYSKPHIPMIVQTAGLHITEPIPLAEDLENFINNSTNGFIFISLGSLIDPNDVASLGNTVTAALGHLPQRVIFKWDPKLIPNAPENFFVQEWLPQTSILNHPKCTLFVTHGGLHSLIESVNFSVPLIGIPFFTDQQHNMALVESLGIGKTLPLNPSSDLLSRSVQEVLTDPIYYENVNRKSKTFKDRIVPPLDVAVYWIEYIMRHEDTSHLKSASLELTWYQYYLLDVLTLLFSLFSIALYTIYTAARLFLKLFLHVLGYSTNEKNIPKYKKIKNVKKE
ncbi:UDP-glycosyltransferase UGT4-like [Planococcus citri]|uniref:UDP-glycosyltransferase UGT4-like n=1 Tax=Planococcus citri TaxID=170843 RepID=UPI0031F783E4